MTLGGTVTITWRYCTPADFETMDLFTAARNLKRYRRHSMQLGKAQSRVRSRGPHTSPTAMMSMNTIAMLLRRT